MVSQSDLGEHRFPIVGGQLFHFSLSTVLRCRRTAWPCTLSFCDRSTLGSQPGTPYFSPSLSIWSQTAVCGSQTTCVWLTGGSAYSKLSFFASVLRIQLKISQVHNPSLTTGPPTVLPKVCVIQWRSQAIAERPALEVSYSSTLAPPGLTTLSHPAHSSHKTPKTSSYSPGQKHITMTCHKHKCMEPLLSKVVKIRRPARDMQAQSWGVLLWQRWHLCPLFRQF